jgi:hypothetical protein
MNKNKTKQKTCGDYTNSIRTSGEVVGLFVREIGVIFILVLFIGAKVH